MNIFTYHDYRAVIEGFIAENSRLRGYRAALAKAAGCQRAYLSQVLHGKAQLTIDHAIGLTLYWRLNDAATEYFLNLLHFDRAAQKTAKRHFSAKLEQARKRQHEVTQHVQQVKQIEASDGGVYYSHWLYPAVHVLLSLPDCKTLAALAKRLNCDHRLLQPIVEQLRQSGLIDGGEGNWQLTERSLHIGKDSPWYHPYLLQWRLHAIQAFQQAPQQGLHYTAIHALSASDALRIRDELLQMIYRTRQIVEPSVEETAIVVGIDCYQLGV